MTYAAVWSFVSTVHLRSVYPGPYLKVEVAGPGRGLAVVVRAEVEGALLPPRARRSSRPLSRSMVAKSLKWLAFT